MSAAAQPASQLAETLGNACRGPAGSVSLPGLPDLEDLRDLDGGMRERIGSEGASGGESSPTLLHLNF
jgi:hypothetical protein